MSQSQSHKVLYNRGTVLSLYFRYNVRTVPLQSTNNRLSDVIRMHSHISKGSNYKSVLSDEIVHLIVVADDLGAISVFVYSETEHMHVS